MKKRILQPEQLIVPYEYEVGNEDILEIYYRIFKKGHGNDLPPVLVARPSHSDRNLLLNTFVRKDLLEEYFKTIDEMGDIFYLMDGNHRGIAATLNHKPIRALELQNDADLENIEKMTERGEYLGMPKFPTLYIGSANTRLSALATCFEDGQHNRKILTLKERVERLASNGDIPKHMIAGYLKDGQ